MQQAEELIRQIIKAHNLSQIYPGRDESSIGDLFQTAWVQIESALYKYEARPHCSNCYNRLRPNDSLLSDEFIFVNQVVKEIGRCPRCRVKLDRERIYYKGKSKVFNMWCVSPNTKVISQKGVARIGDVLQRDNLLYGLNGLNEISATIKKPKQKTLKVDVMYHYDIEATPEHYLFRLNSDGPDWVQLKDLRIGDFLGLQISQQSFVGNDEIDWDGDWCTPSRINPELAYLFGLYLAEGSYGKNVLNIYNKDPEITEKLQRNGLGLKFSYHANKSSNYCCNKGFLDFLDYIGFSRHTKASDKVIPQRLLELSKDNIGSLLSGLFDGDGHSSNYDGEIGFTTTSLELAEQIRMLLLNIGIVSKLYTDQREIRHFINRYGKRYDSQLRDAYLIRLSAIDSLRFYDRIGFSLTRKQANMSKLPVPKEYIYCLGEKFKKLYESYGSKGHFEQIRKVITGSKKITVNKAVSMLQYWREHEEDPAVCFISERLNEYYRFKNRIIWLPVIQIEESESEVCDVEINSEDHSYIANGFISHNSQVARTVILAYIKKENRDRKNSPIFQTHLENRSQVKSHILDRFIQEATELCKFNNDHLTLLAVVKQLYIEDERAHEGLIAKLVERSNLSRSTVTGFLRMLRLRGHDFTDSPMNEVEETMKRRGHEAEDGER